MKCAVQSAFRVGGLLLVMAVGLVFIACSGGETSREPAGEVAEGPGDGGTPTATAEPRGDARRPMLPTASPWPKPTLSRGEPLGSATPKAEAAEAPLPTVSPEELQEIGGDPPPPEGEIDPCTLVTKAEAEEIIEQQVVDVWRHAHFFGGGNICEWSSDIMVHIEDGEPFSSIFLRLDSGFSEPEFLEFVEAAEQIGWRQAQAVPGIGDSAYAVDTVLYVYKGDTLFHFLVAVRDEPDLKAAKELASIALQRLSQYTPPSP